MATIHVTVASNRQGRRVYVLQADGEDADVLVRFWWEPTLWHVTQMDGCHTDTGGFMESRKGHLPTASNC